MKTYTNIQYARQRLVETVVKVDGKAAMINDLTKTTVKYTDYITGKAATAKIDLMDITPVSLGYCNTMALSTYLVRYPVRQDWRQGLRHKTLKTINLQGLRISSDMIPWECVFHTINGDYPKFEETIKALHDNKQLKAQAYCRDFAIYQDMSVVYKEQFVIGKVLGLEAYDGFVEIKEEFEWIREAFEASVVW